MNDVIKMYKRLIYEAKKLSRDDEGECCDDKRQENALENFQKLKS